MHHTTIINGAPLSHVTLRRVFSHPSTNPPGNTAPDLPTNNTLRVRPADSNHCPLCLTSSNYTVLVHLARRERSLKETPPTSYPLGLESAKIFALTSISAQIIPISHNSDNTKISTQFYKENRDVGRGGEGLMSPPAGAIASYFLVFYSYPSLSATSFSSLSTSSSDVTSPSLGDGVGADNAMSTAYNSFELPLLR